MADASNIDTLDARRSTLDGRRLDRLRWRCRRGMLENDLILSRFLDSRGAAITEDEVAALDRLLDLGDNDLWDLLSGHRVPADDAILTLLRSLRAT
jgi:antitoxin CptB